MLKKEADGFTLVELVVALSIFALLSILTTRTLSTASTNLSETSAAALKAQEAMRWVRLVRYDIQGSVDLYVFGSNYPATQSSMCSSARTLTDPAAVWANIGTATFPAPAATRSLFTVVVKDVSYDRTDENGPAYITSPKFVWVGYEIRRGIANGDDVPYELWRVVCSDTDNGTSPTAASATPLSQERVLNLGTTLDATTSGLTTITCPVRNGSGLTFCTEAASTAAIPWYSVNLPLGQTLGTQLNRDTSTLLNAVTRMVGK